MWILTWLCPCNIEFFKWPQNHKYICLYHATAISRDHYEHKILYCYIYILEIYCIWVTVIDFKKNMPVSLKYTCFHHKKLPLFLLAALTVLRGNYWFGHFVKHLFILQELHNLLKSTLSIHVHVSPYIEIYLCLFLVFKK